MGIEKHHQQLVFAEKGCVMEWMWEYALNAVVNSSKNYRFEGKKRKKKKKKAEVVAGGAAGSRETLFQGKKWEWERVKIKEKDSWGARGGSYPIDSWIGLEATDLTESNVQRERVKGVCPAFGPQWAWGGGLSASNINFTISAKYMKICGGFFIKN